MLLDILKPTLNKEKYEELKGRVKELSDGLNELGDSYQEISRAMYYLSELRKVGEKWTTLFNWPQTELVDWVTQECSKVEKGNNTGIAVNVTKRNCPRCGLTPLTTPDQYCVTCDKYVIFTHCGDDAVGLSVTNELILTSN